MLCTSVAWGTREAGCDQRTVWLWHSQGISMKKSWQQQQGRSRGRFPSFVSVWCTVQQTHSLVLAQKQEKVLMWLKSDPSSNSRTFPTSQPLLLPCNPTSLSHAGAPGALTWKTLFQRAVTPDLKWDSKEGELALSSAFPICIGSEKKINYFNKPYICENCHFPRGLLTKNKDGWLHGKVNRNFCMCFSNWLKRDDMDGCSKGCQMGDKQHWCLPAWALCLARARGAVCLLGFLDRGNCFHQYSLKIMLWKSSPSYFGAVLRYLSLTRSIEMLINRSETFLLCHSIIHYYIDIKYASGY